MAELRIPVILNRGQKGIPVQKLARIFCEVQQFLESLGEDLHIERGSGWLGSGFYDGSFANQPHAHATALNDLALPVRFPRDTHCLSDRYSTSNRPATTSGNNCCQGITDRATSRSKRASVEE
jgi:hypothetical protein